MPSPALAEVAVCGFCEFSIFRIRRQWELTESENLRVRQWRCRVTQKSERKPQRRDVCCCQLLEATAKLFFLLCSMPLILPYSSDWSSAVTRLPISAFRALSARVLGVVPLPSFAIYFLTSLSPISLITIILFKAVLRIPWCQQSIGPMVVKSGSIAKDVRLSFT